LAAGAGLLAMAAEVLCDCVGFTKLLAVAAGFALASGVALDGGRNAFGSRAPVDG
jgi:hypothetical protein